MTATPAAPGAYFQALGGGPVLACDRRVRVWTWRLAVERPGIIPALGLALAAAHVPPDMRMRHPQARVAPHLASRDSTTRKGDFGEFLTAALYSGRMGEVVPFEKLSTKPVGGATQQGTDVLTLTPVPRSAPEAVVVEVKTRPTISHPKADLDEIATSLGRVTDEYLESAWRTAVRVMEAHPDHRQCYALPAAISLAKLDSPAEPGPEHARHAVIVTGKASLTTAVVTKYWASAPPVTDLHLIVVPDLVVVMNKVYDHAAVLTYGDVDQDVPTFLSGLGLQPGVNAVVSSTVPRETAALGWRGPMRGVIELALWMLAGWDGMATARAAQLAERTTDPGAVGLARLLAGDTTRARHALEPAHPFLPLVTAAGRLWGRTASLADFQQQARALRDQLSDPEEAAAIAYVASAIGYRYPRHPAIVTEDAQLQQDALTEAGCARVYVEKVSTRKATAERAGLVAALDYLRAGDTLVVWKLDRLGRSVKDVLIICDDLHARGVGVRILTGKLSGTYSPAGEGKFFFTMMAAFAELERDIIHERTMAGLAAARAQGRNGGRPTVMDADKLAAAKARRVRGESSTEIARALGVSRASVYRHLGSEGKGG